MRSGGPQKRATPIAGIAQARPNEVKGTGTANGTANQQQTNAPPVLEKRTTRRMQRQMRQEQVKGAAGGDVGANAEGTDNLQNQDKANADANELVITQDDEKLYLIDPQKRSGPALSDEVLDQIQEKAQLRSKRLAKQARKEIKAELNKIMHTQLHKLEAKFAQLQELWQVFDMEIADIQSVREECLAERIALSTLKSQKISK